MGYLLALEPPNRSPTHGLAAKNVEALKKNKHEVILLDSVLLEKFTYPTTRNARNL